MTCACTISTFNGRLPLLDVILSVVLLISEHCWKFESVLIYDWKKASFKFV